MHRQDISIQRETIDIIHANGDLRKKIENEVQNLLSSPYSQQAWESFFNDCVHKIGEISSRIEKELDKLGDNEDGVNCIFHLNKIKTEHKKTIDDLHLTSFMKSISCPDIRRKIINERQDILNYIIDNNQIHYASTENLLLIMNEPDLLDRFPNNAKVFQTIFENYKDKLEGINELVTKNLLIKIFYEIGKRKAHDLLNEFDILYLTETNDDNFLSIELREAYFIGYLEVKPESIANDVTFLSQKNYNIPNVTLLADKRHIPHHEKYEEIFAKLLIILLKNLNSELSKYLSHSKEAKTINRVGSINQIKENIMFLARGNLTHEERMVNFISIVKGHINATLADHAKTNKLGIFNLSTPDLVKTYRNTLLSALYDGSALKNIPAAKIDFQSKEKEKERRWRNDWISTMIQGSYQPESPFNQLPTEVLSYIMRHVPNHVDQHTFFRRLDKTKNAIEKVYSLHEENTLITLLKYIKFSFENGLEISEDVKNKMMEYKELQDIDLTNIQVDKIDLKLKALEEPRQHHFISPF